MRYFRQNATWPNFRTTLITSSLFYLLLLVFWHFWLIYTLISELFSLIEARKSVYKQIYIVIHDTDFPHCSLGRKASAMESQFSVMNDVSYFFNKHLGRV